MRKRENDRQRIQKEKIDKTYSTIFKFNMWRY